MRKRKDRRKNEDDNKNSFPARSLFFKEGTMRQKRIIKWTGFVLTLAAMAFVMSGCLSRSKAPYLVNQYALEYNPPALTTGPPLDDAVRIERFSVAQTYNTRAMVYKSSTYRRDVYPYSRWRVNPGDMVTDFLLRDFRGVKPFRVVLSFRDTGKSPFVIEGGIEEFLQSIGEGDRKAVLSITAHLVDSTETEITKKILFQKRYHHEEKITGEGPEEFARAMSVNMSRFSGQLMEDVYLFVKARGVQKATGGVQPQ